MTQPLPASLPRAANLAATPAAGHATLRRLAQDFEAQAIAAMFQPVFAALPTDGPFGGRAAEAQWRPMLVDAIARDLARAGGLGLAAPVFRELLRAQEATVPTPENTA